MFELFVIGGGLVIVLYFILSAGKTKQSRPRTRGQKRTTSRPRPSSPKYPQQQSVSSVAPKGPADRLKFDHENSITGRCYVIDGDTIRIGNVNIRLVGIDAPELDHPWGKKAKWELFALCKGHKVRAVLEPDLSYDRVVATCFLPDGRDLSAEMVKCGLALDWPKFSGGKYSPLEPEGARKKHWKAAARQRGHMHVFHK